MTNQFNRLRVRVRRKRRPGARLLSILGWSLLAAVLIFVGVLPAIEALLLNQFDVAVHSMPFYGWVEWIRNALMQLIVAAWFFALGSMVGSFANVVVYRMPLGKSVIAKPSACPYCNTHIRLTDNVPVLGWVKLRGRCRTCRLPISSRYPIVELVFGLVFLLLFYVELQSAGANLPNQPRYHATGILAIIADVKWNVIGLYAFHTTLLCLLLIWALMAYDNSRIPIRTFVFAILVGAVAPLMAPFLYPVTWEDPWRILWYEEWLVLGRLATGFLGLTCGYLLGGGMDVILNRRRPVACGDKQRANDLAIGMTTVGLFLGWQSATSVALMFSLILMGSAFRPLQSQPRCIRGAWLVVAVLLQICLWATIHGMANSLDSIPSWAIYGAIAVLAFGIVGLYQQFMTNVVMDSQELHLDLPEPVDAPGRVAKETAGTHQTSDQPQPRDS